MSVGAEPGWDHVHAVVREDGSGEVRIGGIPYPLHMTTLGQVRGEVMRGMLSRIGMRVPPSTEERSERADEAVVAQHSGPDHAPSPS
ncbi:hypothetical protein [Myceligenerans indicum]|uniref:hypothetical protein n=1 Tax=Myceligenerans indicum TaxID=2593663 RepID=UPI00191DB841|nr:hypothetical protein [Myceligenerans indicum]